MKTYWCQCGNRVFFDNNACLGCGRELGFDPLTLDLLSLDAGHGADLQSVDGRAFWHCRNRLEHGNCNWLVSAGQTDPYCLACGLNELIPALDVPGNLRLWARVEAAKRRLLFSLLSLGLPLQRPHGPGLRFRIMEDRRRNPAVFETFIATAHLDGTVTVNIAEADDATREAVREQMQERYRTVLGHLRHESGHFYFSLLTTAPGMMEASRAWFGDERLDYPTAMQAYYRDGPPGDWRGRFVSAYAAAHPAEDFAETFAHLLHIRDALETARDAGLVPEAGSEPDSWINDWIRLSVTLNEIARSLGTDDTYPFVLTPPVRAKLSLMNQLVCRPVAPGAG